VRYFNPDYIPAIGVTPVEHPDQFEATSAPVSLNPTQGHPTFNLDRSTGTLICRFNQQEVEPELIRRAIGNYRKEFGDDAVKWLEIVVCAEVMAGPSGVWLCQMGFERQPDVTAKTAMYRWRKAAKPPRKNGEKTQ